MAIFHTQNTKHNCGQIAVACLAEVPVQQVEALVGHTHGTRTGELLKALNTLGWRAVTTRCKSVGLNLPDYALLQVRWPRNGKYRGGWHWVALAQGIVFDGCMVQPLCLHNYRLAIDDYPYVAGGRITASVQLLPPQATAEQTRQK